MKEARNRAAKNALPGGSGKGLFTKSARTVILVTVSVLVVCFLVIPLLLSGTSGANAVYVSASAQRVALPDATPTPLVFASEGESESLSPDPAALPEATDAVQVSQYAPLQENDDYPAVQNLQVRLMELGYLDSDEPSTLYNAATTVAVSLFQRTLDYDMNGVADSELQEHLFSNEATPYELKLGDSGTDVESLQSRLTELGYYDGKNSGFFGVATEDALAAFQTKNGLDVTSVFKVGDRDVLYSPSAKPKIDPTPTPAPKATKKPSSGTKKTPVPASSSGNSSGSSSSSGSASSSTESASAASEVSYSASYSASGIISVAQAMLGKPYSWSDESPSKGFDCSGLVYFCLRTCGVSTSRYSASGFSNVSGWGYVGSTGELQAGDLVFFKSDSSSSVNHTGIFIGGGRFIHASSSAGKVLTSSIGTDYWTRNFINGRRVF